MKRGGRRRYYRPEDVDLLKGIRQLLYDNGYTIKGVQKLLRQEGIDYVKNCWRNGEITLPLNGTDIPDLAGEAAQQAAQQGRRKTRTKRQKKPVGAKEFAGELPTLSAAQRDSLKLVLSDLEACKRRLEQVLG